MCRFKPLIFCCLEGVILDGIRVSIEKYLKSCGKRFSLSSIFLCWMASSFEEHLETKYWCCLAWSHDKQASELSGCFETIWVSFALLDINLSQDARKSRFSEHESFVMVFIVFFLLIFTISWLSLIFWRLLPCLMASLCIFWSPFFFHLWDDVYCTES